MQTLISTMVFFLILMSCAYADSIDRGVKTGAVMKMLREMGNQTKADTLNLPANATSIRENITDTFSCENRTYGYYADVDNDCQIFHVCLTSQGASGRNTTYRWSFICPQETIFNQEVLVCTRPRESIPCEESPDYYDLNMEIGKLAETEKDNAESTNQNSQAPNRNVENIPVKNQRKPLNRKKQNIIVQELMKEAMEEMEVINDGIIESQDADEMEEVTDNENKEINIVSLDKIILDDKNMVISNNVPADVGNTKNLPVNDETISSEYKPPLRVTEYDMEDEVVGNTRLASERSLKRKGRKYRGSIKFRSDRQ